jgi:phosphoribosylamine--glycine ligase
VVGSGAREHALAWCAARSPRVAAVVTAPGNAGTARLGRNVPVDPMDTAALAATARREEIDLAIVGPDDPLAAGAVDALAGAGVRAFGPTRAAAQIEASKVWAKDFMRRHDVPTAPFAVFDEAQAAHRFLAGRPWDGRVVVKADGLARGKGALVCDTLAEAHEAVSAMLERGAFGPAGRRVVVEQRLDGPEASVFALCDGETALPFGAACDHKRVFDGERGPNTGGMGAFSPTRLVPPDVLDAVRRRIFRPAVAGLAAAGRPFTGFLFANLLFTAAGPQVLEFNARFGDPEAQAIFPLLESDLVDLVEAALEGRLAGSPPPRWRAGATCAVCLASAGYPGAVHDGFPVAGLAAVDADALVFHAGTVDGPGGALYTRGGRILTVVGQGPDLAGARERAYANVGRIRFEGMHYRRDIGASESTGAPG